MASQTVKHTTTIWLSNSTLEHIYKYKSAERRDLNKYLYASAHSNIIHNSQKVEANQTSTDGWVDTQKVVYACNGILFSLQKEEKAWMNLEEIVLSEINRAEKDRNTCMITLMWGTYSSQIHRNRK